jgi:hypothetical protein
MRSKVPLQCMYSRGHADLCEYLTGSPAKQQALKQTNVVDKINRLESLVHSMMSERQSTPVIQQSSQPITRQPTLEPTSAGVDSLPANFGRLALDQP